MTLTFVLRWLVYVPALPIMCRYASATPGILARVARRLLEGNCHVAALLMRPSLKASHALRASDSERIREVVFRRSWVRLATPEERHKTGAVWVDAPATEPARTDRFVRVTGPRRSGDVMQEEERSAVYVPPLSELHIEGGYWAERAQEARREAKRHGSRRHADVEGRRGAAWTVEHRSQYE